MGILLNLTKEYFRDNIRTEDGVIINIEGKKYILKYDIHPFAKNILSPEDDDDKMYIKKNFDFFDEPVYLFCSGEDGENITDYYYIMETDLVESEKGIIGEEIRHFINSELYDNDDTFKILDVLYKTELMDSWVDLYEDCIFIKKGTNSYNIDCGGREIKIYDNEDTVNEIATKSAEETLNESYSDSMSRKQVESFLSSCGDSWIDEDAIEEYFEEDAKNYIDEIEEEKGEHGTRLFDEMINSGIIEDTSEYFEVDLSENQFEIEDYIEELIQKISETEKISKEEAERIVDDFDDDDDELIKNLIKYDVVEENEDYFNLDYNNPKFNIEEKKIKLRETRSSGTGVEDFLLNFGELYSSFYDLEKLAELVVELDGRGIYISSYDNEEYTCHIDDTDYYCYIVN